jgi:hypothetical protein
LIAYQQCQAPVDAFLGGPWQMGLFNVNLVMPTAGGWSGGARWFRCDLEFPSEPDGGDFSTEVGVDVRGLLAKPSAFNARCVRWFVQKTELDNITPVNCSSWFNGEFAGLYTAPDEAYPSSTKAMTALAEVGCEGVVAHFLGFSGSTDESSYVGPATFFFSPDRWAIGDRTVPCYTFAYQHGGKFLASVKGIKAARPKGF